MAYKDGMIIEQDVKVLPGGKLELIDASLPEGATVHVRVEVNEPGLNLAPKSLLGWCRGQVWMAEDFDAPLEEFRDYVE